MANHMAKVAEILGVELGEEFELRGYTYKLTEDGLICPAYPHHDEEDYEHMLRMLLIGEYTIKLKPWKPKNDEKFWYVNTDNTVGYNYFDNQDADHVNYYKIGNCYRTFGAAKANLDKWVQFYASDEVLEV